MVEGGSVIAAFFLAHNYVSEQFGNYVEYGKYNSNAKVGKTNTVCSYGLVSPFSTTCRHVYTLSKPCVSYICHNLIRLASFCFIYPFIW